MASQPSIARAIHLSHPARANSRENLIWSELCSHRRHHFTPSTRAKRDKIRVNEYAYDFSLSEKET
jgi:hypothetical protein